MIIIICTFLLRSNNIFVLDVYFWNHFEIQMREIMSRPALPRNSISWGRQILLCVRKFSRFYARKLWISCVRYLSFHRSYKRCDRRRIYALFGLLLNAIFFYFQVSKCEDLDNDLVRILPEYEKKCNRSLLHCMLFYWRPGLPNFVDRLVMWYVFGERLWTTPQKREMPKLGTTLLCFLSS